MTSADAHSHDSSTFDGPQAPQTFGEAGFDTAHDHGARGAGDELDLDDELELVDQVGDDIFDEGESVASEEDEVEEFFPFDEDEGFGEDD